MNLPQTSSSVSVYVDSSSFCDHPLLLAKRQVGRRIAPETIFGLVTTKVSSIPTGNDQWKQDISTEHLTADQAEKLLCTLEPFSDLFAESLEDVTNSCHRIDVVEEAPVRQRPYHPGPAARKIIDEQMQRILAADVTEPSSPEWARPVVLVPKPDGSFRFCVDCRALNLLTKRDSYPLPRFDDSIDSLGKASWFSTLHANSGFWQIPLDKSTQKKSNFTCHAGLYSFKGMPLGIKNTPATFQCDLGILACVRYDFALVYLGR